jgi:hypothetical protein
VIFAEFLNEPSQAHYLPDARIVGAYRGGSAKFSLSRNRINGFAAEMTQRFDVQLYDSLAQLTEAVDAILLESCDGRQHLEQFRQLAIGKPVFVDKPFATTYQDALEIVRIAEKTNTPLMSCSSLRYAAGIADLLPAGERVIACEAFGYAPILEDYPGLFWYGIHSAEMLFRFMGFDCRRVRCFSFRQVEVALGEWADGRTGVLRGVQFGSAEYGCVVHTDAGLHCGLAQSDPPYLGLLLQKVLEFFRTGNSPVDIRETLGIAAFLEAANQSRAHDGTIVELPYVGADAAADAGS